MNKKGTESMKNSIERNRNPDGSRYTELMESPEWPGKGGLSLPR